MTEMVKDFLKVIVKLLAIIAFFVAIAYCGDRYELKQDKKVWNNGICTVCHGELELINVHYEKNAGSTYFYKCKECQTPVGTHTPMTKK